MSDDKSKNTYQVGDLVYDADIYDGLNTSLADLDFYKRWMPKNKDARVLELCCGTGRLTIPIAKEGYRITGVDIMASMLEKAKAKARESDLIINFIEADIRQLNLSEKFDLIFIPFNSIHHLYQNEDLFNTFMVVKKHLKEGGLFLLDCYNPDIAFIANNQKEAIETASYTTDNGKNVRIKQKMRYESHSQVNRIEWHYYIDGEFDSNQNLDMRMYYPQELDSYLKWHDFEITEKFGDFDETAFANDSPKQIFVCKRS